jgi:hypothetical protein
MYRVFMEQLTTNIPSSLLDTQSVDAEFVRTELELAFSLLNVAAVSERRKMVSGCVRNALSALRTASRFLSKAPRDNAANVDICQLQDELLKRVREIARQHCTERLPSRETAGLSA